MGFLLVMEEEEVCRLALEGVMVVEEEEEEQNLGQSC